MKSKVRLLPVSVSVACLLPLVVYGQNASAPATPDSKDLYSIDLGSLLNMTVTTASKFSEKLSDAPGVMTVVTQDELLRFGGLTLSEILDRVPGLALSSASFTDRSIIAVNGDQTQTNGGHVLFLINGRPIREILEGGLVGDILESFPVAILERIEVIRGPGSVLYGSDAYSGVINLITKRADGDSLVVTGMGAQGGGAVSHGEVSFQRGDLSIVGAGQYHQNPVWDTPVWSGYGGLQNEAIPNRSQGAYLGVNYKGLSFMSSFTDWNTDYIEGAVGDARWRRGFANLGYALKATAKWDMNFDITYSRTTLNAVQSIPFISRDSSEAVFEWSNKVTLTKRDRLTFGALYNHQQGHELFYASATPSLISHGSRPGEAAYVQLDHELLSSVKLIGGLQANKIGNLSLNVVPRAGVIWSPNTRFSVKALYSEAYRAPSINETSIDYVPPPTVGGPSLIGNPNLLPEKVATTDLEFSYQGNRFQASINLFHSRQTDNIVENDVTADGTYINLGEAAFYGAGGEVKYYLKKNFFLTGSLLYQTNHDGNGNTNITPIANFGAKAGVGYKSPRGLSAGLFHVYQGPLYGYTSGPNPTPGAYNLMNANLRYDLSKYLPLNSAAGLAFVAHADNLLNIAVWLPDWKDNPGGSIFAFPGRTVYLGIELAYKKGD
jgi:outer membrane receptor for ferrienterochelin and colicin